MSSVSYVPKKETIVVKCTDEVAELLRRMEFILDDDERWSFWAVGGTQVSRNGETYAEINVGEIHEAISQGALFNIRHRIPISVVVDRERDSEFCDELYERIVSQYESQLEEVDG